LQYLVGRSIYITLQMGVELVMYIHLYLVQHKAIKYLPYVREYLRIVKLTAVNCYSHLLKNTNIEL